MEIQEMTFKRNEIGHKFGSGKQVKNWLQIQFPLTNSKNYVKRVEKLSPLKFGQGNRGSIRNMKFSQNRVTEQTSRDILKKERKTSQDLDLKGFREYTYSKPSPIECLLDDIETKSIQSVEDFEERENQMLKQSIILTQCESFQPLSKLEAFYFTQKRLKAQAQEDCNKSICSPTTTNSGDHKFSFSQSSKEMDQKFQTSPQ